jgi:uncharacterized phage-associated protein
LILLAFLAFLNFFDMACLWGMTFRFNMRKATEVASLFIKMEGGKLNVMKLVKLVYLLDRTSIARRGIPVVGGIYYSLRNGPVTSELLDVINAGKLADDSDSSWEQYISDRDQHEIALQKDVPIDFISESEIKLIEETYQEHGAKDQWQIRDWCHQNCGEWTSLPAGRERIMVEEIAVNVGKSAAEVKRITEEAVESNLLSCAFSASSLVYA